MGHDNGRTASPPCMMGRHADVWNLMQFWMIVNEPAIAAHIVEHGVGRIFVDLENLGKQQRQGHLDTWMSPHRPEDITGIRAVVDPGRLLVRLNPWHEGSPAEIDSAIAAGADWLMLPMFRTLHELESFCALVDGRVPVIPLVETAEALGLVSRVARVPGVAEVFIGLNDLRLSLGLKFLFEPLVNGILDQAGHQLNELGIPWGFGGLARYGEGLLPAELILGEHRRLGSSRVILSRTFHRMATSLEALQTEMDFGSEVRKLRDAEEHWQTASPAELTANHQQVREIIDRIVSVD